MQVAVKVFRGLHSVKDRDKIEQVIILSPVMPLKLLVLCLSYAQLFSPAYPEGVDCVESAITR